MASLTCAGSSFPPWLLLALPPASSGPSSSRALFAPDAREAKGFAAPWNATGGADDAMAPAALATSPLPLLALPASTSSSSSRGLFAPAACDETASSDPARDRERERERERALALEPRARCRCRTSSDPVTIDDFCCPPEVDTGTSRSLTRESPASPARPAPSSSSSSSEPAASRS